MSSSTSLSSETRPARPAFFRSISSSSSVQNFSHELFPRKGKPRLYLGLYVRGGSHSPSSYSSLMTCDSYHWSLLVGSESPIRSEGGTCFQITHTDSSSLYEEIELLDQSQAQSEALLARITLAKITDEARLRKLLRTSIPANTRASNKIVPKEHPDCEDDTSDIHATSICLSWVKEAYKALTNDSKCLRGYIHAEDWPEVEEVARMYMKRKRRQGRFGDQGRMEGIRTWDPKETPTWNFWENRETTD